MRQMDGRFCKSLRCALAGLRFAWASERHFRFHVASVVVSALAAVALGCSAMEWVALLLTWALVIGLELANSAIEALCDRLHPERDPAIGRVKDMAAAAVMIASIAAIVIGAVVFGPKIAELVR